MNIKQKRKLATLIGLLGFVPIVVFLDPLIQPFLSDLLYIAVVALLMMLWGIIIGLIVNRWIT